jgi:propanol-preferring alcohol dehydrogenase
MVLDAPGHRLRAEERPTPRPGPGQVRVRVEACGICRTDVHIADGELARARLPLVLGHQVIGVVEEAAPDVAAPAPGARVGVSWLAWACGACDACRAGRENLCPTARFTGHDLDGGFAEECLADARFCVPAPAGPDATQLAPLLCAGAIGWRALQLAGPGEKLGLYGFGAAARLVAQVARRQGRQVFAFGRPGDVETARAARALGAAWAGGSDETPPATLDAAILFAPAGELVPRALAAVAPGGTVVCAEIHMSDIPAFPYALLWGERVLRSVANVTRADVRAALDEAPHAEPVVFPLAAADEGLQRIRAGSLGGHAVLVPGPCT